MIKKMAVVGLMVSALLAATNSTPVSAHDGEQQDSGFHVNDEPRLDGQWWQRRSSRAQGGEYWVTHGVNRHDWEARAVWEMGHKHGRQQVWVYIPRSDDVQATVDYRVYANGVLDRAPVSKARHQFSQRDNQGWQKIGEYTFNGADVRIEVWDNETDQTWDSHGADASRFAVDAVAMKCTRHCGKNDLDPANAWRQQSSRLALQKSFQKCLDDGIARLTEDLNRLANVLDAAYAVGAMESTIGLVPGFGYVLGIGDVWGYFADSGEDPFADDIQKMSSRLRNRYFNCTIW